MMLVESIQPILTTTFTNTLNIQKQNLKTRNNKEQFLSTIRRQNVRRSFSTKPHFQDVPEEKQTLAFLRFPTFPQLVTILLELTIIFSQNAPKIFSKDYSHVSNRLVD